MGRQQIMLPVMRTAVPAMAEAAAAADVLAEADARIEHVSVYGSVARGIQDARSDIDLLVIVDDLDYPQRGMLSRRWGDEASAATWQRVICLVTDWAEWSARVKMTTSMEKQTSRS